ncbi:hypothetical protein SESBI_38395 [Sesbania bispinosa]|nr:hypothetical protein SESBI_38395 [Sesbania bispinosa]
MHGKQHVTYYVCLSTKTIGRPTFSPGKYASTNEEAGEDVAIVLLRRVLAGNGVKIIDYNYYNIVVLQRHLKDLLTLNWELKMDLKEELRIGSTSTANKMISAFNVMYQTSF